MANVLGTQTLEDGVRNTIIKLTGTLDTADEAYTIVADPANFSGFYTDNNTAAYAKAAGWRMRHIEFTIADGLSVEVFWDAATPVLIWALEGRGRLPAEPYGTIKNNATAPTGKIGISTLGWEAGSVLQYSFTLHLIKVAVLP